MSFFSWLTETIDLPLLPVLQGSGSLFFDRAFTIYSNYTTWTILYLVLILFFIRNNKSMQQFLLVVACAVMAVVISYVVDDVIVKPLCMRLRPCNDTAIADVVRVVLDTHTDSYSFYSGHASNTMALALFIALIVRNRALTMMMLLWSIVNGYSRVYLAMHFPTDVIIGFCAGALIATAMYLLYSLLNRRLTLTPTYISKRYTTTGYAYADIFLVNTTITAILLYILTRAIFTN